MQIGDTAKFRYPLFPAPKQQNRTRKPEFLYHHRSMTALRKHFSGKTNKNKQGSRIVRHKKQTHNTHNINTLQKGYKKEIKNLQKNIAV
ncbi:hypothetical protein [Prevotella dentasini]|uniref:hypothetical protein n=1 Tax=Prevotella dentasini TaxID=589537 RepID=UPI0011DE3C81|nr:hypothetical protein [Prevotella dentasini]